MQKLAKRVSLLIALVAIAGCGGKGTEPSAAANTDASRTAAPRVTTVAPLRKTLTRKTEQPGQVEPFEETNVVSKISGFIERIAVEMGDRVKGPEYDSEGKLKREGQILAELTVPEMQQERLQKVALVAQAEAEAKQAQAAVKVAEAMIDSAKALVHEAEAGAKRAEAVYERWQSELKRLTELAAQSAVTPKVVDETRSQAKSADAARDEIQAKLASAKAGVAEAEAKLEKSKADVTAAEARTKVAEADLKRVEALLEYSKIRAPFDGVVSNRHVHTGHLVQSAVGNAGKPLFTVTRIDKVRIFIDVPESEARFAEQNRDVEIHVPSAGNKVLPTDKIAATAWILDPATRTLKVEIDLANEAGELRPGMYVTAILKLAERKDVLTLPAAAIVTENGKSYCVTVEDGKIARKEIVVGLRAGSEVEIVSGLSGGEAVVALNPGSFTVGQAVEIATPVAPK